MTWEVEVNAAGRYEAIVHYTCPEADVGSAVELSLDGATWSGTIAEAHDPPLRGRSGTGSRGAGSPTSRTSGPCPSGSPICRPGGPR
jgi:hypothetical protein